MNNDPTPTKDETADALRKLLAKASPLPWSYRPDAYDDWGFIRGGEATEFGLPVVAISRGGQSEDHDAHRRAGTDPYRPNGELIVAAVNALPDLLAALSRRAAEREGDPFDAEQIAQDAETALHKNFVFTGRITRSDLAVAVRFGVSEALSASSAALTKAEGERDAAWEALRKGINPMATGERFDWVMEVRDILAAARAALPADRQGGGV